MKSIFRGSSVYHAWMKPWMLWLPSFWGLVTLRKRAWILHRHPSSDSRFEVTVTADSVDKVLYPSSSLSHNTLQLVQYAYAKNS